MGRPRPRRRAAARAAARRRRRLGARSPPATSGRAVAGLDRGDGSRRAVDAARRAPARRRRGARTRDAPALAAGRDRTRRSAVGRARRGRAHGHPRRRGAPPDPPAPRPGTRSRARRRRGSRAGARDLHRRAGRVGRQSLRGGGAPAGRPPVAPRRGPRAAAAAGGAPDARRPRPRAGRPAGARAPRRPRDRPGRPAVVVRPRRRGRAGRVAGLAAVVPGRRLRRTGRPAGPARPPGAGAGGGRDGSRPDRLRRSRLAGGHDLGPAAMSRRLRRLLAALLLTAGALLVADALATLVWQEPLSALLQARAQRSLDGDLRRLQAAATARAPAPVAGRRAEGRRAGAGGRAAASAAARRGLARAARRLDAGVPRGSAIGRLEIPALDLRVVMVHGSDPSDLRRGPGTIDGAPLPGAHGTAAIAGHRTTYGAPFRDIDQL